MNSSIYTDGGARGNPGISAYGLIITDPQKKVIYQQSKFLGIKTNNEAEYMGIVAALTWVKDHHQQHQITSIDLYSDSQLIIRQINGDYKVKAKNLKPFYNSVQSLISQTGIPFHFHHIRRHLNQMADDLANQAMDDHS